MMTKYSKGLTPSAIQHKYKLTYEQGFELATILNNQQAEINRLREALDDILRDTPSCFNNSCPLKHTEEDCQHYEICFVKKAYKALNSESEGK